MKKPISLRVIRILLLLITFSLSLSCSATPSTPQLGRRKLRIHPDGDKFYYQYEECANFLCLKKNKKEEFYQMTDKELMKRLRDMKYQLVPVGDEI